MATSIIDVGVNTRSTNYVGPGTIDANAVTGAGVVNFVTGNFTGNNNTIQINCGFKPRSFELVNETDGIIWRKHVGMAAANAVKTNSTGPTVAIDTNSHVLFGSDNTITLTTTAVPNNKVVSFIIFG